MRKNLNRILLYVSAASAIGCWLAPCHAAELQDGDYGLGKIMSAHAAGQPINISSTLIKGQFVYVADFYGDGLIQFSLPLSADLQEGPKQFTPHEISETVAAAASGSLSATSFHTENDLIVLDAPGKTGVPSGDAANKSLTLYSTPWIQPAFHGLKKHRMKITIHPNPRAQG